MANGVVYFGAEDGRLYALSAERGRVRFTAPVGEEILGSPTIANGMVFVGTYDNAGNIAAFALPEP